MTYKTLSYIHNLLVNAEQKADCKMRWFYECDYCPAKDDFSAGSITKSRFEEIKTQYEELRKEYYAAYDALKDFEDKRWS